MKAKMEILAEQSWTTRATDKGRFTMNVLTHQVRLGIGIVLSLLFTTACGDEQAAVTITDNATATERPATSPADTPCIPTELSPAAVELVRLYEELHTFKDDSEFLRVGFVLGGPYSAWLQAIKRHGDATPGFELLDELGFSSNEVMMLGMNYMDEDFSESDLSAIEYFEIKIQAGLASARCNEPGSEEWQEIVQAASESRNSYAAETEAQILARESLLGRPLTDEELALERLRDTLEAGEEYPGQRTERAAVAELRPLVDRMRKIGEQRRQEYEAALARFSESGATADVSKPGTWAAALAAGEAVLDLTTVIAAEMSALATELAELEATAPPEVAALAATNRMVMEQALASYESAAAGLQPELEKIRAMVNRK